MRWIRGTCVVRGYVVFVVIVDLDAHNVVRMLIVESSCAKCVPIRFFGRSVVAEGHYQQMDTPVAHVESHAALQKIEECAWNRFKEKIGRNPNLVVRRSAAVASTATVAVATSDTTISAAFSNAFPDLVAMPKSVEIDRKRFLRTT
ncbi:hypothetical protein PIB30_046026 [Stylosanthes scabra]|uniref:Uncharacterized protein n=1 Tax=Stylosanthes scabra TaxID=79078 RepID=A0ABU6YDQ4_9FABA|nr:hypothetical protein [Stylosanthes scabra]